MVHKGWHKNVWRTHPCSFFSKVLGEKPQLRVVNSQLPLGKLQLKPLPVWGALQSSHQLLFTISPGGPTSRHCSHMQGTSRQQLGHLPPQHGKWFLQNIVQAEVKLRCPSFFPEILLSYLFHYTSIRTKMKSKLSWITVLNKNKPIHQSKHIWESSLEGKKPQHILLIKLFFFLITVSPGSVWGIEKLRDTLILCHFPFNTEALEAHGKGHSVHVSTWGDLGCTNKHPDTQISHVSHMALLFGSNPARLPLASCWCFLKDAKCPLKGEKPAQDGVERLCSWNIILETAINCRGELQMKDHTAGTWR